MVPLKIVQIDVPHLIQFLISVIEAPQEVLWVLPIHTILTQNFHALPHNTVQVDIEEKGRQDAALLHARGNGKGL